ncbi:RNA polymerase [Bacillus sp. M6-12]|uniref:RNA polymerase sigma factor n=1 Tax=Bacillus sp. M6-12 TaxID=2054166 RepID=UPI000C76A053|nr:RNA polymerase sigma factor [Bacillus sp. M6-12]PLS16510.1 RNA polymerase [Bacillus sp. M6-12]
MNNADILEWFELYSDDIYQFLFYRVGSADVEDLVQEVFLKAIKGQNSYQEKSNPKTWLYSIARNVAADEVRKRNRFWKKKIRLKSEVYPIGCKSPEEILLVNEENRSLFLAIQSLRPSYREVLILRGIKGLSVTEAALALDWGEKKVRSTYHRARKALNQQLGGLFDEE